MVKHCSASGNRLTLSCRPTAKEVVTLLAEIEEDFRQQGRMDAITTTNSSAATGG